MQRAIEKDKQFRDDKEKLKEHGYRWVRRVVQPGPDPVFRWALLDPQGQEVTKEQALRDIAIAENPESDDFDYPVTKRRYGFSTARLYWPASDTSCS
ncbi:hypothetical protein Arth_4328 (plasmid) [Arthrobacter sp. FB24]|nr:hypothetical protein Arth_4328 [Arthrobacter sp. FB24]